MVYIDRNGRVLERRPWDLARVIEIFTGLWFVVVHFFTTLLGPFLNNDRNTSNGSRRNGWGGGGPGGGGNSGGGGGFGGGRGPQNRRIGRVVNTSMDCNIPGGG